MRSITGVSSAAALYASFRHSLIVGGALAMVSAFLAGEYVTIVLPLQ
jgi:hypothetical protein